MGGSLKTSLEAQWGVSPERKGSGGRETARES